MSNPASTFSAFSGAAISVTPGAGRFRVWVDQPQAFSTQRVEAIHHNFHEHPLMQLPELAKLAKDLSATKQCRFITPDTQQASAFADNVDAHDGRTIDETRAIGTSLRPTRSTSSSCTARSTRCG